MQAHSDDRSLLTARVVRTVEGDVPASELGPTDAHDHFFFESPLQPGDEMRDVGRAIDEAASLVRAGVRALVDWTPIGLGRNVGGLREVAGATGLRIVAATGVHRDEHYGSDHPLRAETAEALADRFVADIATDPPSGVIKIGAGYHCLRPFEERIFAAAAAAHARTGVPLCVHTEHGTMGLGLVERLGVLGVPPESLVLAHLDRNPDTGEHAETAATGAWLQFDGPGRAKYWPDSTILTLIAQLRDRGYASRILLGQDTGRRSMMRAYGGGPGMDYLFTRFRPRLERELGQRLSSQIFEENPARAFSFVPTVSPAPSRAPGGSTPLAQQPLV